MGRDPDDERCAGSDAQAERGHAPQADLDLAAGYAEVEAAEDDASVVEADAGTRTPDPFITSEVLYQLSYVGGSGKL